MNKALAFIPAAILAAFIVLFLYVTGFFKDGYVSFGVDIGDSDRVDITWRGWYQGKIVTSGRIHEVPVDRVSEVKDSLETEATRKIHIFETIK